MNVRPFEFRRPVDETVPRAAPDRTASHKGHAMNEPDDPPQPGAPPSILQFLASHQNGATVERLSDSLREIVAHLEQLNQDEGMRKSKGSLTIKITLDRDDGIYRVGVECATKVPNPPNPKAVFWATAANGLVQQDPRQRPLPFQDVPRRAAVIVPDA